MIRIRVYRDRFVDAQMGIQHFRLSDVRVVIHQSAVHILFPDRQVKVPVEQSHQRVMSVKDIHGPEGGSFPVDRLRNEQGVAVRIQGRILNQYAVVQQISVLNPVQAVNGIHLPRAAPVPGKLNPDTGMLIARVNAYLIPDGAAEAAGFLDALAGIEPHAHLFAVILDDPAVGPVRLPFPVDQAFMV